jgi:hypothetical protein
MAVTPPNLEGIPAVKPTPFSRRGFLRTAALGALTCAASPVLASFVEQRSVSFVHTHTGEQLNAVYFRDGMYDQSTLLRVAHAFRRRAHNRSDVARCVIRAAGTRRSRQAVSNYFGLSFAGDQSGAAWQIAWCGRTQFAYARAGHRYSCLRGIDQKIARLGARHESRWRWLLPRFRFSACGYRQSAALVVCRP